MSTSRTPAVRLILLGVLGAAALAVRASGDDPPPTAGKADGAVKLQVVKLKAFQEALKGQRGKVVVLDLWADFCIPCKKEFPHLVELHRRYADKGLTAVSLSLDPVENQGKALKFLQSRGAAFPNYLLDEHLTVWQEHYDISGPPAVFVYDRTGKLAGRFDYNDPDRQFTYDDVTKLVRKLLSAEK